MNCIPSAKMAKYPQRTDLRGLIGSIGMMEKGLNIYTALDMGITNKSFDEYEQTLIRDTIRARISRKMSREQLFC